MLIFDLEERNPINPDKTVLEPATSASLERHMKYVYILLGIDGIFLYLLAISGYWINWWTMLQMTRIDSTNIKKC